MSQNFLVPSKRMALLSNSKVVGQKQRTLRFFSSAKYYYDIPERYRNCFYLANAAFFDSTNWFLHRAYEKSFEVLAETFFGSRTENIIEILDQCNSVTDVRFPVKKRNGKFEIVRGFVAQYGQNIGHQSGLGGLRIGENITRDQMKALSVLSSFKNHCMGLNMYGCQAGIKICPKDYSEVELKDIVQLYTIELCKRGYCLNNTDIFYSDLNANEKIMTWISTAFNKYSGLNTGVVTVGKSVDFGGLEKFEKCAALGAFKALNFILNNDYLMDKIGISKGIEGKTFILQDLGKIGLHILSLLVENGAICVGVIEQEYWLYDSKGIDVPKIIDNFKATGSIANLDLARPNEYDKIYMEDCDLMILSGRQKSLICNTARDVKAKVILEASNGPVTPTSQRIFEGTNKIVVPDIYSASGSNVASYFEYIRTLQQTGIFHENILKNAHDLYVNIVKNFSCDQMLVLGGTMKEKYSMLDYNFVNNALDCVYIECGHEILKNLYDYKLGLDLRSAAYIVAIKNMFKTLSDYGKFE